MEPVSYTHLVDDAHGGNGLNPEGRAAAHERHRCDAGDSLPAEGGQASLDDISVEGEAEDVYKRQYYTWAVENVINGTWTGENYFGGMADGLVGIAPLAEDLIAEGTAEAIDAAKVEMESGWDVFDGVIETNDGSTVGVEGEHMSDADITGNMNWYFKNVVEK